MKTNLAQFHFAYFIISLTRKVKTEPTGRRQMQKSKKFEKLLLLTWNVQGTNNVKYSSSSISVFTYFSA